MTARGLRYLKRQTGIEEYSLAIVIAVITAIYLITGEDAPAVANTILTVVPLLITYVFPKERPSSSRLLVYWYLSENIFII